ncbi:COPII coat Sec23p-Sfb3p heterodimer component [Podochytrium sp. JEL0797]|nr:COPII coat Sec23p-Sfb3p heterodimer component [Podochytrium sp. JEL0797]
MQQPPPPHQQQGPVPVQQQGQQPQQQQHRPPYAQHPHQPRPQGTTPMQQQPFRPAMPRPQTNGPIAAPTHPQRPAMSQAQPVQQPGAQPIMRPMQNHTPAMRPLVQAGQNPVGPRPPFQPNQQQPPHQQQHPPHQPPIHHQGPPAGSNGGPVMSPGGPSPNGAHANPYSQIHGRRPSAGPTTPGAVAGPGVVGPDGRRMSAGPGGAAGGYGMVSPMQNPNALAGNMSNMSLNQQPQLQQQQQQPPHQQQFQQQPQLQQQLPSPQSAQFPGGAPSPLGSMPPPPVGGIHRPGSTPAVTNRSKRVYAPTHGGAPPVAQSVPGSVAPSPGMPNAPVPGYPGQPQQFQGQQQVPASPQNPYQQQQPPYNNNFVPGQQPPQQGGGFVPQQPGAGGFQPRPQAPMPQQQPQQPRNKIDPNQIPSPLVVHDLDQANYDGLVYSTSSRTVPPLAATRYKAADEGNCNPRFMRFTTYQIPHTEEVLTTSMLPMGAVIQPLADLAPGEMPVPVVDFGEAGPLRCRRCRAYVNPWFNFTEGGRKMICNLCGCDTEVPPEYFCNLDMSGRRMDLASRPELLYGAVEFRASKEYSIRAPKPPSYVFAIDVSWTSVQFGVLRNAVQAIKGLLYEGGEGGLPKGCKVGLFTFDRSVHFYNLKSTLENAHMMVVPDVNDMFVPLSEGFLVDPWESRTVIENLLNSLPGLFEGNRVSESILGAAAQAAMLALKDVGGKLFMFQTSLPTHGPGALKNREDVKLLGTDNEKKLYEPQEYFWRKMGEDYSKYGISVDLFLFPSAYIDVATIGSLSSITGGDLYVYTNFDAARDGYRFMEDLKKVGRRNFGFEGLLRVRCSDGLGVSHHFGNFCIRSSNPTDVELAGIDSQKAIAVAFKHERKLEETGTSSFQVALLYTNFEGDRRIRVLNMALPNTGTLGNVFRCAEMDATINYLAKASVAQAAATNLKAVREQLTDRCVKILAAYRKHSASNTSPGQLILPESFKLYPLYTLSLLKCRAFRSGMLSSDARITAMRHLRNMGVPESVPFFYPRMFGLHNLEAGFGALDSNGTIRLPACVRVSFERLDPEGMYLLENGVQMFLWVGRQCSPELVSQVFGVQRVEEIDVKMRILPVLDNKLNQNVRLVHSLCQLERPRFMQVQVVRQQLDPPLETEFASYLVEDQNHEGMTYVDFLCFVHRNIQMEMSN